MLKNWVKWSSTTSANKFWNITISLKVAPDEKIALKHLAVKHNVSLSELLYNLVMWFKDLYKYIGKLMSKKEKLGENLRFEIKKKEELKLQLENADYRVKMEQQRALEAFKEKDEFTYMVKKQQVIVKEQAEENKDIKRQIEQLRCKNQELEKS